MYETLHRKQLHMVTFIRPRYSAVEQAEAQPRCSGVVAECGPAFPPWGLQPGHEEDLRALLVVADTQPVPERGDQADVGELAAEEGRVQVHRYGGGVGGG